MRAFWLLLPAGLSALALGAHFLRRGEALPLALCLALVALLALRRRWVPRVAQAALALTALVWLRTAWTLAAQRRAAGQPWARMAVILGAVALVAALAALAFETRALRRHYGRLRASSRP